MVYYPKAGTETNVVVHGTVLAVLNDFLHAKNAGRADVA
jgi:hypothetical protein